MDEGERDDSFQRRVEAEAAAAVAFAKEIEKGLPGWGVSQWTQITSAWVLGRAAKRGWIGRY